ncbi:MAG: hypothetical protein NXI20_15050 [bacterium]|nr:hypothetical protein [bacterium]
MIEAIAYIALAFSLASMSMRDMLKLRFLHIASSLLYGIYGFFISSTPLIIGAIIFISIHCYRLRMLKQER